MNINKTFLSKSAEDTEKIAGEFASSLRGGCVISFKGGLGMGKTAFVRGMAKKIAPDNIVLSPTFTLINEYRGDLNICHMDAYRLSSPEELFETGFYDYAENNWVCCVEWSENVEGAFTPDYTIEIKRLGDNEREITICGKEN